MRLGGNDYTLRELGGAFGDLGTLVPFLAGYITITGIDPAGLFLGFGVFGVVTGLRYRTPIAVQPMKAIGTAAISHAGAVTPGAVWASAVATGILWLAMGLTGVATWIAGLTSRPVVQGSQEELRMNPSAPARVTRRAALGFLAALAVLSLGWSGVHAQAPLSQIVILSTTTSTQDSGLLDILVPMFEKKTGMTVKTISVGTGQALALAARGEADVTLAHAPSVEKKYVEDGKMRNRRLVMYNDFVLIGPEGDPAKVKGLKTDEALRRIAASQSRFVSRGDKSGTHTLELALWKAAGVEPKGAWYIESGQGMGQTLGIANDRRAYTITDRGTWLAFQKRITLPILVEKDRPLLNLYSVMEVNPANGPRVNQGGGKTFADFMLSPDVQGVIKTFGVDKYGQALFVPIAGKKDEDF